MAIVKKKIDISQPLTQEQRNRIVEASRLPLMQDEDAPELTDLQIEEIKAIIDCRQAEDGGQDVTIHLTEMSAKKVRDWGSDYKNILNRVVNLAISEPELLKKSKVDLEKLYEL